MAKEGSFEVKVGLAEMLKGGVIMDVMNADQAKIAEDAGAVAVMALERIPALIREEGGIARASDPQMIKDIQKSVSIPVMAKVRIGHFAEAQMLEALEVDFIDESEVLTPADNFYHVDKNPFKVPFVCGARNLSEALRRINEGAAMIRTKGEAGSGNVVEAVKHMKSILLELKNFLETNDDKLNEISKKMRVPIKLLQSIKKKRQLPVPNFSAGGIATPADAALLMQLGAQSVFVGSGIFKSTNPEDRARAIVQATIHYDDADILAKVSRGMGGAMKGIELSDISEEKLFQKRGW